MFINYSMPHISAFESKVTTDAANVAPGWSISIEPNKGEIRLMSSDRLKLHFAPSSPPPRWMELSFALPCEEWKACRHIFLRYRASGTGLRVRQAVRLGNQSGFHDLFGAKDHQAGDAAIEINSEFHTRPKDVETAEWMDFKIFFEPKEGRFELYDLSLTGVK